MNRLKMLKRQMFGRARLDLLSHRFLLAPRRAQRPEPRPQEPVETSTARSCIGACMTRAVPRNRIGLT